MWAAHGRVCVLGLGASLFAGSFHRGVSWEQSDGHTPRRGQWVLTREFWQELGNPPPPLFWLSQGMPGGSGWHRGCNALWRGFWWMMGDGKINCSPFLCCMYCSEMQVKRPSSRLHLWQRRDQFRLPPFLPHFPFLSFCFPESISSH